MTTPGRPTDQVPTVCPERVSAKADAAALTARAAERPRLRHLEAFAVQHDGEQMIGLRDPAGFTDQVALLPMPLLDLVSLFDGDRRRICGASPIYALLRALPGARGRLLRYSQWPDPQGAVTFCAAAFS
jgi:hypothetical protein